MISLLLVEDEEKLARFVELELAHGGYEVEHVSDGRTAVDHALANDYDLILLDILLPQLNGMEVLRRIRREKDVPVIMLTARDAVMDKVAGLDAGADDYITKPFAIEELLARVRVALKRREARTSAPTAPSTQPPAAPAATAAAPSSFLPAQSTAEAPTVFGITVGNVCLNTASHQVFVDDSLVELTAREFEVLRALMSHTGRVMSRDLIAQEALGYDYVGETNIVDVHVAHLRAKIDDRFNIKLITTVRGVGYVVRPAD